MKDFRNLVDNQLELYYAGNDDIKIETNHDDFLIAYVFGKELSLPYDALADDVNAYIKKIDALHEQLKDKTLFRFHRGLLASSMKTIIGVTSLEELRQAIFKENPECPKTGEIKIFKYGDSIDTRNGWDTHLVTWNGAAVGMANGMLE